MIVIPVIFAALAIWASKVLFEHVRHQRMARTFGCKLPPKYPHKDPIFGLDVFLQTGKMFTEHTFWTVTTGRFASIGKTFEMKFFGKRIFQSMEAENFQSVFVTNARIWGVGYRLPPLGPYFGKGFLTTDGVEWQRSRQLFSQSFHKQNTTDYKIYNHYLTLMMSKIPRDGSTVDLQELTFALYMDTATLFLFGESFEGLSQGLTDDAKGFVQSFNKSFEGGGIRIALGPLMFLYRDPSWQAANQQNHEFVQRYVDKALTRSSTTTGSKLKGRKVLLDSMAEEMRDRIQLRNEVTHAFAAAHETTACLISNIMWVLARRPEIQSRLRHEVLALGNVELDFEMPMKIQYLQDVINEALRLYPVFPYHIREASEDCILPKGGGPDGKSPIFVRAGDRFEANYFALQTDKDIWGPDSLEFKPERWSHARPLAWEFAPFAGGPRGCVGKQKALMETSFYVARMLQEFGAIEARDNCDWTGQVQITAKNLHGVQVAMTSA